jgi:hypothetical protein
MAMFMWYQYHTGSMILYSSVQSKCKKDLVESFKGKWTTITSY